MAGLFIQDGQEYDGYIAEVEGLHPSLSFTFRPTSATDQAKLSASIRNVNDQEKKEKIIANWLASRIASWDAEVEVSGEMLLKMHQRPYGRLTDIIHGSAGSDPRPDGTVPERFSEVEAEGN